MSGNRFGRLRWFSVLALLALALPAVPQTGPAYAQGDSRTFPETNHTVKGKFLEYWNSHGGLAQQGYPISGEMQDVSETDGKTYTMQYFERAVFELHPENQPPNDVLLSLVGNFQYHKKYPMGAPDQKVSTENPTKFDQTGHSVGGKFLAYWQSHGGLAQQGYPISDEFQEKSDLNGKTYTSSTSSVLSSSCTRRTREAPTRCSSASLARSSTRPKPTCRLPTPPEPPSL